MPLWLRRRSRETTSATGGGLELAATPGLLRTAMVKIQSLTLEATPRLG
jgi:hypothetical protein